MDQRRRPGAAARVTIRLPRGRDHADHAEAQILRRVGDAPGMGAAVRAAAPGRAHAGARPARRAVRPAPAAAARSGTYSAKLAWTRMRAFEQRIAADADGDLAAPAGADDADRQRDEQQRQQARRRPERSTMAITEPPVQGDAKRARVAALPGERVADGIDKMYARERRAYRRIVSGRESQFAIKFQNRCKIASCAQIGILANSSR